MDVSASASNLTNSLCDGCENTLTSFILMSENAERLQQFLIDHGILKKAMSCSKCQVNMWYDSLHHRFICNKRVVIIKNKKRVSTKCGISVNLYKDTLFEKGKVSVKSVTRFVALWALMRPPLHATAMNELGWSSKTVVDWCYYLREICFILLCSNPKPIGGPGTVVEIDQVEIGRWSSNRGKKVKGNWVLGGIDRESKDIFLVPIGTQGQDSLLPIIKENILPGTTIISDWKKYECLQSEGFHHLTADHHYSFNESDTGAHKQNIFRMWREVKSYMPKAGIVKHIHGHIAEFLFKRKYPEYKTRIHHIWCAIRDIYPGNNSIKCPKSQLSSDEDSDC